MALDTAKVTTRSNSDCMRVENILIDRRRPSHERMADILRIALEWREAIDGSVPLVGLVERGRVAR